jgi:hypothetical protein
MFTGWLTVYNFSLIGGAAKGPRGPKSFFYLLPQNSRAKGLKAVLSAKFAQVSNFVVVVVNGEMRTTSFVAGNNLLAYFWKCVFLPNDSA